MPFLEIDGLRKRFHHTEVLKDISLSVDEGDFLVLVGPSGCGKSTLLNTIAGLENLSAGEIRINGRSVNGLHPSERDIAMVFQSYALYPNMNVAQNIGFGLEMRGVPKAERARAIDDAAKLLQIDHLLKRKPGQLSGGQRQRVAMGRALVRKPQVFLFDEPLSNLDAKLRVDMRTEIKRLHQRLGTTIVYVTHDQVEAMTLATRIAVLKDGELQQVGTPQDIYTNPANLFVADFMGSPAMNLIPARIERDGDALTCASRGDGAPLRFTLPAGFPADAAGRDVILGLRPEAIGDAAGAHSVSADCLIDMVETTGSDVYALTRIGGREVTARLRADADVREGTTTALTFNLDRAVFFEPDSGRRVRAA